MIITKELAREIIENQSVIDQLAKGYNVLQKDVSDCRLSDKWEETDFIKIGEPHESLVYKSRRIK